MTICAVRDTATDTFGRPFFVNHPAQAVRSFGDEVKNSESELCKHPEDFELWQLGAFDDQTGKVVSQPERIARAIDLKG